MLIRKILCRVLVGTRQHQRRLISQSHPLRLQTSPVLMAEPLKKKKKLDPAIVKAREEKKKKRIEKQIRRLEKGTKQLKPIIECEIPEELDLESETHDRAKSEVPIEEINQRIRLLKDWTNYKSKQHLSDLQMIDRIWGSQLVALDELKMESDELYEAAIEVDDLLTPFTHSGPVESPSIIGYNSPDGEYIDISKKWSSE